MLRTALIIAVALMAVGACTAGGGGAGSGAAGPSAASPGPSNEPATSGDLSLSASIIDPIVADAAGRLGVDPSAVIIVEARTQTFPDGSLGCPQPGEMYTQALVDGYQVIVDAGGSRLDYRGSGPGQFRLCENP